MTGAVVSGNNNVNPEFHAPTSLPSDPKSIGLFSPSYTEIYSTYPEVSLNVKFEDSRFAAVPLPPLIAVMEPLPSS